MIKEIFIITMLLTSNVAFAAINSTKSCQDNTTLLENITIYKDGNASSIWTTVNCPLTTGGNCDNTSKSCSPPTYMQNIYLFGLVLVAGLGTIFLLGRLR